MSVQVEPVSGKAGLRRFIEVPIPIFRDDPAWVQPLAFERIKTLKPEENPYFEHAEAQYFIAVKDGRDVGRISAQVDQLAQQYQGEGTGHFGFLDATDDQEVFDALFAAAEAWLKEKGMSRALGPFSLSINEETGLLVDGFDTPPAVMMNHARPYYDARVKGAGYQKATDMFAYALRVNTDFPERTQRILRKAEQLEGLKLRQIDMKNFNKDLALFIDIFNDAWSDNWGFIPMTQGELEKLGKDLKPFLKPEICRIAFWEDEPIAFMLTLPDVNAVVKKLNGRLFPFGWFILLKDLILGCPPRARVPLMGVKKEYQGSALGAMAALELIDKNRSAGVGKYGLTFGELSWILEDNTSMNKILEMIDSHIYKTYRMYEKQLAQGSA